MLAEKRISKELDFYEAIRMKRQAKEYILNYFKDKVSEDVFLYDERYLNYFIFQDITDICNIIYKEMKEMNIFQSKIGDGSMTEDTQLVIDILKDIKKSYIPKEYSAGILLMHLELVEGLSFLNAI